MFAKIPVRHLLRNTSKILLARPARFLTEWAEPLPISESYEKRLFERQNVEGIRFGDYGKIPVSVTEGAPAPIESLSDCGFPTLLQENIARVGFNSLTPVQQHAIPCLLANNDLMACAQTGSGKTAAFLLPMIAGIYSDFLDGHGRPDTSVICGPAGLVITPTRELAVQIHEEALKFSYRTRVTPVLVHGGVPIHPQISKIRGGSDIIIGTPGRLIDLLERKVFGLNRISHLVLDEADRMLDMGFDRDIAKIHALGQLSVEHARLGRGYSSYGERTTAMFSATFPPKIQKVTATYLNGFNFLEVGKVGAASSTIEQHVEMIHGCKINALCDVIETIPINEKIIVFCNTKAETKRLAGLISGMGVNSTAIHGDLNQSQRDSSLRDFRTGKYEILIATDVASRGLDIPNVNFVVNYDLPNVGQQDAYIHRIGRTGRSGNPGTSISFFTPKDAPIAPFLLDIMLESEQQIPEFLQKLGRVQPRHHTSIAYQDRRGGSKRI